HQPPEFMPELKACRDAFAKQHGLVVASPDGAVAPQENLRITLVNDVGGWYGAGIAHVRLGRALARAGNEATLVSILDRPGDRGGYTHQGVVDRVIETRPDLVVVGNLHGAAADPMLLNLLSDRFPTLVVLHDFWVLTGRCAYTGGCERYL